MAIIKGIDLNFYINLDGMQEIFCMATDFSMNVVTDSLETTGPNNGAWRSYIPAMNSYTLSVPGVVSYTENLNIVQFQQIQNERRIVEWTAGVDPNGGVRYSGEMFITSINNTSQFRDAVKFDMTCQGTGPLGINISPTIKTVYLADTTGKRLAGCPNPYPVGVLWYDGTFIGVANNADDVIEVFNDYATTQGGYLQLISYSGGCDFTMAVAWNSPLNPDIVIAIPGDGFVMAGEFSRDVIGEDETNNNVISA